MIFRPIFISISGVINFNVKFAPLRAFYDNNS